MAFAWIADVVKIVTGLNKAHRGLNETANSQAQGAESLEAENKTLRTQVDGLQGQVTKQTQSAPVVFNQRPLSTPRGGYAKYMRGPKRGFEKQNQKGSRQGI